MHSGDFYMLLGFALAAYTVVGNDVIQTLGTFISSNKDKQWWVLWIYLGGILAAVLLYGWFAYDGDMTYGKAYLKEDPTVLKYPLPDPFPWFLVIPPLVLLIVTQFGIPVSTTFLVLALFGFVTSLDPALTPAEMIADIFDTQSKLGKMVFKSVIGYVFAFGLAALVYLAISKALEAKFIKSRDTIRIKLHSGEGEKSFVISVEDIHYKINAQEIGVNADVDVDAYISQSLSADYQKLVRNAKQIKLETSNVTGEAKDNLPTIITGLKDALSQMNPDATFVRDVEQQKKVWTVLQWISTGFLWSQWLQQDLVNIYVYLPRKGDLTFSMMMLSLIAFVGLLGIILYQKGGEIQKLVTSKRNTADIRSATIIDFIFGIILLVFKGPVPMSTTWVFVGLLAGREIMMTYLLERSRLRKVFRLVLRDLGKILLGLLISVVLAILIVQLK